jgi:hypothetical protein
VFKDSISLVIEDQLEKFLSNFRIQQQFSTELKRNGGNHTFIVLFLNQNPYKSCLFLGDTIATRIIKNDQETNSN